MDAATYRLLRAIAEFDRREAWGVGFNSTAHWLTWRVGIDMVKRGEAEPSSAPATPAPAAVLKKSLLFNFFILHKSILRKIFIKIT
jgi:hypothetical protein